MELTIKSTKLNRSLTFFLACDGGYVYVNTNGKEGTLGEQICTSGMTNSVSTITATEATLEKVCRNWLRKYIRVSEGVEISPRGRPVTNNTTVAIRLTAEEHEKLKRLNGSKFVREAIKAADDRPLYVFYKIGRGNWDLEVTTAYYFCKRHDIKDYESWKGTGDSLEDVMDFEDKSDALNFIEMEIDDPEKANELTAEIKAC